MRSFGHPGNALARIQMRQEFGSDRASGASKDPALVDLCVERDAQLAEEYLERLEVLFLGIDQASVQVEKEHA
jgi:hypothetical protein